MADTIVDEKTQLFGQMLQRCREAAGVTQQEIAQMTGLTKNYISAMERGLHKCNAQTFIMYAKICGQSLDVLAGIDSQGPIKNAKLAALLTEMSEDDQMRAYEILRLMR